MAVIGAGYAAANYRQAHAEAALNRAEEEQAEAERRRRDAALAEAYGDRSSLEELQRAIEVYEAQRRNE